jgi:tripartite-type tricarboxylate transporter receptor subunit TctC
MTKNDIRTLAIVLCGVVCSPTVLYAQGTADTAGYPNRPIRVVVPFTPGGQPDIVARLLAPKLSEIFQQQVVVDNRAGAGGVIGGRIVATSTPDGYTLMSVSAAHSIQPYTRANMGYHPLKDFAGVSLTANAAYYLVVPATLEVRTVKELIALAKAKPGQLNFASAGAGSATHFGGELFKFTAGVDMVHIPHRGIPEALTDAVAGRSHFFMAPFGSSIGLIKEGRLRALAVSTVKRSRVTPDIPTIGESGLPGFRYDSWNAWYAPVKTPRAVINKLNREVGRVLKMPEVADRLLAIGIEPAHSTPEELDKFTAQQVAEAGDLARKAGIKPE